MLGEQRFRQRRRNDRDHHREPRSRAAPPDAFKAFNLRVKEFEKANPHVIVKPVEYQWTGPTFSAQLAAGTLPTVFNVPFTDSQSLANAGQLADITSDVKKLPYANKFNKSLLQVAENDKGDLFGIPYGPYAYGLSYNRALFTKAGLDPNKPPTSWDEVRTDAKTISDKLGDRRLHGLHLAATPAAGGSPSRPTRAAAGWRSPNGGKTTVTADNDATVAALKFLQTMRWTDNSLGSNFNLDWSGMNQYFGSGQTAMYPSGSDVLTSLVQSDGVDPADYGLGLIPTQGDNSGVLSGGNVAVVSADGVRRREGRRRQVDRLLLHAEAARQEGGRRRRQVADLQQAAGRRARSCRSSTRRSSTPRSAGSTRTSTFRRRMSRRSRTGSSTRRSSPSRRSTRRSCTPRSTRWCRRC